ncbi:hypothetical protein TNCV_1862931 [Trichonephila clavipes]|nr:hypothetical protein TNCV_1862931 [Trichonephila clavipes]
MWPEVCPLADSTLLPKKSTLYHKRMKESHLVQKITFSNQSQWHASGNMPFTKSNPSPWVHSWLDRSRWWRYCGVDNVLMEYLTATCLMQLQQHDSRNNAMHISVLPTQLVPTSCPCTDDTSSRRMLEMGYR